MARVAFDKVRQEELIERLRRGDESARGELMELNGALVTYFAKRYTGFLSFEDLFEAGNEGLIRGFLKYDPDKINPETGRHYKPSTYVGHHIEGKIRRAIQLDLKQKLGISIHSASSLLKFMRAHKNLSHLVLRELSLEEISSASGFDFEKTVFLGKLASLELISLDSLFSEENAVERSHFLAEEERSYADVCDEMCADDVLSECELTWREELVFRLRIYDGMTFKDIGDELGVARQRAHSIYGTSCEKLREYFEENVLV